eukprot:1143579-Pelagomonas_calceolata.AAC.3
MGARKYNGTPICIRDAHSTKGDARKHNGTPICMRDAHSLKGDARKHNGMPIHVEVMRAAMPKR